MTNAVTSIGKGEILVRFTDDEAEEILPAPEGEDAETQALWPRKRKSAVKDVPMKVADLASGITDISSSIQAALETPKASSGRFHVDSFEIGLAVNASGKVVLVAEVGIEASITVTFKRSP